jgi:hypothetical protein
MIPGLRNRNYVQLCWIVPDLEASISHWVKSTGAGPFFVFEELHFEQSQYRGQPSDIQACRAAIGQFGDMQIELVVPQDANPGLWTELVPKGRLGFHHVGLYCTDYDGDRAAYLADGSEMAFEGLMMGARTCYIDTSPTLGFMTELITANPVAVRPNQTGLRRLGRIRSDPNAGLSRTELFRKSATLEQIVLLFARDASTSA